MVTPSNNNIQVLSTSKYKGQSGGFTRYPTGRDMTVKSSHIWLKNKIIDDDVGDLWRVHDCIYDLTDFISQHPGGKVWLQRTRGSDITEAFESSHLSNTPEELLKKYFVKEADKPRVSPYTFKDEGFYKTLKRKVAPIIKEVGQGPSLRIKLYIDVGLLSFMTLLFLSCKMHSYGFAMMAGVNLAVIVIMAHNFFHQKDNWRMYIFDLSLLSSDDWRISHILSHHLFPNTIYDFEVTMFEPLINFFPYDNKTLLQKLWLTMTLCCNYTFLFIGITVAHHHPDIYHEGDKMRMDPDFGLCQLDAVREKKETLGSLLLSTMTFGDHTLHHLFPTIDHSKLHHLYSVFLETCEEFNISFSLFNYVDLVVGSYQQMGRVETNSNIMIDKNLKKMN